MCETQVFSAAEDTISLNVVHFRDRRFLRKMRIDFVNQTDRKELKLLMNCKHWYTQSIKYEW